MSVRLKLQESDRGLRATISQRSGTGQLVGKPSIFIASSKEEAKQRAKSVARGLGLKTYGIVDKTGINS
jgi:hypothetical protein